MRPLLRLASALFLAVPAVASAQTAGTCAAGTATATLAANDVRARLFTTGALFGMPNRGSLYAVPRPAAEATPSPSPISTAVLWMGGTVNGDLRMSAARYSNHELWPGPLGPGATLPNAADCARYDRIFRVTRADLAAYAATGALTADLREWPAAWGAPVVDGDGVAGNYNLAGGDRPLVLGTETAWWVMNDVGAAKRTTGSSPLGVEVRVAAFGLASADPAVDRATLVRYTFVNRGTQTIAAMRAGLFSDTDLGHYSDDYVGSDSARSLAYTYNADDLDESEQGYGAAPPAFGVRVVEGPLVPAPGQTWTDPDGTRHADARRLGLGGMQRFESGPGDNGTPRIGAAADWYHYLSGRWKDDRPVRACGNGFDTADATCPVTTFMYSGDPVSGQGWSERTLYPARTGVFLNATSDRHFVAGVGPFDLAPGTSQTVTFAYVYARGTSNLASVAALRDASDRVQAAWNAGAYHRGTDGTAPVPVVSAPALSGPTATVPRMTAVTLSWRPVDGNPLYEVQIGPDLGFTSAATRTYGTTATAFTVSPDTTGRPTYWRVRAIGSSAGPGPWSAAAAFSTDAEGAGLTLDRSSLGVPRPNPAAGRTLVPVGMPGPDRVRVDVVDALGRRVAVAFDGAVEGGWTGVPVDVTGLASGVYVVRLHTSDGVRAARLVVAR